MNNLTFIYLIGFILLFASCERDVNIDFPDVDQKIVVEAFLSPQDDEVVVGLTLSKPYVDGNSNSGFPDVNNASVSINNVPLTFLNDGVYRTSDLTVIAGQTYTLEVSTPDGKRVTAQCTVPNRAPTQFDISEIREVNDGEQFDVAIQDEDPQFNYYGCAVERRLKGDNGYIRKYRILENSYFSDDNFVDQKYVLRNIDMSGYFIDNYYVSDTLFVNVYYSDENFFEYFNALELQDSGDIFAEPVLIPTNINGGYGIFAGVNSTTKVFVLH